MIERELELLDKTKENSVLGTFTQEKVPFAPTIKKLKKGKTEVKKGYRHKEIGTSEELIHTTRMKEEW